MENKENSDLCLTPVTPLMVPADLNSSVRSAGTPIRPLTAAYAASRSEYEVGHIFFQSHLQLYPLTTTCATLWSMKWVASSLTASHLCPLITTCAAWQSVKWECIIFKSVFSYVPWLPCSALHSKYEVSHIIFQSACLRFCSLIASCAALCSGCKIDRIIFQSSCHQFCCSLHSEYEVGHIILQSFCLLLHSCAPTYAASRSNR